MPGISDYLVCNPGRTWDMAKIECQNLGMHLAKVNDKAEEQWLDNTPIPNDLWVMGTIMSPNFRCAAVTIPPGLILGICGQDLGYVCEID